MAPPEKQRQEAKGSFYGKSGNRNQPYNKPKAFNNNKRKWVHENNVYDGSIGEGQGFAFKRREKVKHEYNKLLRKEQRTITKVKDPFMVEYPEHLRHLYEAEAEQIRNEIKTNRINRRKCRIRGGGKVLEDEEAVPMTVNSADKSTAPMATNAADKKAAPMATNAADKKAAPLATNAADKKAAPMATNAADKKAAPMAVNVADKKAAPMVLNVADKKTDPMVVNVADNKADPMVVNVATSLEPAAEVGISIDQTGSSTQPVPATGALENDSFPMSNRSKKKMLRKTSYQKSREEFESVKTKKQKKKEEFLKNQKQKEEAIERYKRKKMERYQILRKKTKKGQPNFNAQMEFLLQKIQETSGK